MAADKLSLYNDALRQLGSRRLASLSEEQEGRFVLDDLWLDQVRYCLEQGLWRFAMRTQKIEATIDVAFGPQFGFEQPGDLVRLFKISTSETLDPPLLGYLDEDGKWFADVDTLFVRYVSSAIDPSKWPATFAEYVGLRLAKKACMALSSSESKLQSLDALEKRARIDARSKDAMREGAQFLPTGSWARARLGSSFNRENG